MYSVFGPLHCLFDIFIMEIYSSYVMQLLLKLTVLLPRPYLTLDHFDALFRTFGYHTVR